MPVSAGGIEAAQAAGGMRPAVRQVKDVLMRGVSPTVLWAVRFQIPEKFDFGWVGWKLPRNPKPKT